MSEHHLLQSLARDFVLNDIYKFHIFQCEP